VLPGDVGLTFWGDKGVFLFLVGVVGAAFFIDDVGDATTGPKVACVGDVGASGTWSVESDAVEDALFFFLGFFFFFFFAGPVASSSSTSSTVAFWLFGPAVRISS